MNAGRSGFEKVGRTIFQRVEDRRGFKRKMAEKNQSGGIIK